MSSNRYKLAIVGSRNMYDYEEFCSVIEDALINFGIDLTEIEYVVSGGAKGADKLAEIWAKEREIKTVIFKPNWEKYGRSAGVLRNKDIIDLADLCIAFPSMKGAGTQSSINLAKKKQIPLHVHYID